MPKPTPVGGFHYTVETDFSSCNCMEGGEGGEETTFKGTEDVGNEADTRVLPCRTTGGLVCHICLTVIANSPFLCSCYSITAASAVHRTVLS